MVQDALARSQQSQYASASESDAYGFEQLTDEALLMANELVKKRYALPDVISERSIRLAHLGLKAFEQAQQ